MDKKALFIQFLATFVAAFLAIWLFVNLNPPPNTAAGIGQMQTPPPPPVQTGAPMGLKGPKPAKPESPMPKK